MSKQNLFNLFVFPLPEHVYIESMSEGMQFYSTSVQQGEIFVSDADIKMRRKEVEYESVGWIILDHVRNVITNAWAT